MDFGGHQEAATTPCIRSIFGTSQLCYYLDRLLDGGWTTVWLRGGLVTVTWRTKRACWTY